jgi:glycerol-3-phosphate acyltransferase PlsX
MRIALDAMGGDHGVPPSVAGGLAALAAAPDLTLVLVGDQTQIDTLLAAAPSNSIPRDRLEFFHCTQSVGMDEKPADALRKKPDNSITRCWQLLAEKKVDGFVSAGNTGAVVAGGLFTRRFLKGVRRPGIATLMPTAKGKCVIMDVGANVFPKPSHLLQYGIMGRLFAQTMLNIDNPTIGLMNVGEEEGKGNELVQQTYELFRNGPIKDAFVGNIEGRDIHRGKVDVVVTDGFVGNVILKLAQGVFEFTLGVVSQELIGELQVEKELASQKLKALIQRFHYSSIGGAPLLGIDGVCIIAHGSSNDRAISSAINVAVQNVRAKLNEKITAAMSTLPTSEE